VTKIPKKKKTKLPDLDFEEDVKKKTSFISKLKKFAEGPKRKVPITFNLGLAIILFFCYLSVTFVSIPTTPALLIVLLPTLYILLRYIKLERDTYDEKQS